MIRYGLMIFAHLVEEVDGLGEKEEGVHKHHLDLA